MKLLIALFLLAVVQGASAASSCVSLSHTISENDYHKWVFITDGCQGFWEIRVDKDKKTNTSTEIRRTYTPITGQWVTTHKTESFANCTRTKQERWSWSIHGTQLKLDSTEDSHCVGNYEIPYIRSVDNVNLVYVLEGDFVTMKGTQVQSADRYEGVDIGSLVIDVKYPHF